ncbi:unnamed protein product, partial [Cladocopium goreaui]
ALLIRPMGGSVRSKGPYGRGSRSIFLGPTRKNGGSMRIFSSNEQLRRGHSFTVPDRVSQSSEAMADAGYGLRLTTYGRLLVTSDVEAQNFMQNLATPQTRREARNAHFHSIHRILGRIAGIVRSQGCKLLPMCLALAFAVAMAVRNLQFINDPPHPEIFQKWLPWWCGPGLTPEALVWSAWTQAIILPLLGVLGTASFILRLGRSKNFTMEMISLLASLYIFLLLSSVGWCHGLAEVPPTEERQRTLIEASWFCHVGLLWLTWQKLRLLGWWRAQWSSWTMWFFWYALRVLPSILKLAWTLVLLKLGWTPWIGAAVTIGSWLLLILATGLQAWALWAAADEAFQFREIRKNWARQVDREVFFLRCAAVFSIWDSLSMPLAEHFIVPMIGFGWHLALDAFFMLVTMHVLGYEADTLEDIGDMARLQGKRIAFPGKVNPEAKDCIVSFPGKYNKEWDDAVKEAQGQSSLCSLACVFLTDKQSGLGDHVEDPEGCGSCFCQALYGNVDPAAYLSAVEEDLTEQKLLFQKSDAEAMGQVLLIRQAENDASWTARKKKALLKAADKCKENRYRAPWGCRWFAEWKKNVDKARKQGQKFHVFYFEGKMGCGKMAWEELNDDTKLQEVRDSTGLGKSQTAEVAWLDRLRIPYEEHDVGCDRARRDFCDRKCTTAVLQNFFSQGTLMLIRQMIRGFWDGAPSGSVPDFSRKIGKNSYTTSGNWILMTTERKGVSNHPATFAFSTKYQMMKVAQQCHDMTTGGRGLSVMARSARGDKCSLCGMDRACDLDATAPGLAAKWVTKGHNAHHDVDEVPRDPMLSELGHAQAASLRSVPFVSAGCELLVVSPLSRAIQMASAVFGELPMCRTVLTPLHSESALGGPRQGGGCLDETLRLRSEIARIKAQGEKLEGVQDALKGFQAANGVLWFHQEAGPGVSAELM